MDRLKNDTSPNEERSSDQIVLLTLPISCQICLGKVKAPVVCSNQHVFCKQCLEQWVKKSPYCPACRVPINEQNPFKKILGSMDEASQEQINDPTLKSQLRRTRLKMLYDEFHNEIDYLEEKLLKYATENKGLKTENDHLRRQLEESELKLMQNSHENKETEDRNASVKVDSSGGDINTILKISNKLQEMITLNESITQMNTALRKELKSCRAERDLYVEDLRKLKEEFNFPQANQKYNASTVAALEAKIEDYEREIALLKKELRKASSISEESRNDYQNFTNGRWVEREKNATSPQSKFSASEALKKFVMSNAGRHSPLTEPILAEWDRSKSARGFIKRILADANLDQPSARLESTFNRSPPVPSQSNHVVPSHSNHVDSLRFPACAKLIELTKGRSDQSFSSTPNYPDSGRISGTSFENEKLLHKSDEGETITVVFPSSDQSWSNREWKFHSHSPGSKENAYTVPRTSSDERAQTEHFSRQSPSYPSPRCDEPIVVVNPDTSECSDGSALPVKKIKLEDMQNV